MKEPLVADLFDRYHLAVNRYFQRMTGQYDLAQDLTQETFLRAVRRLAVGPQVQNETAYLFQIAHNVMVDHWRKAAAAPPVDGLVDVVSVDPPQRAALTLQEALETLPTRDRDTFALREVNDLGYTKIAAVHDATLESVRSRLRRARARLRLALKGEQHERSTRERRRRMKREHEEALAALFDGEPVDPAAVNRALAGPEAPALLADLAALRALAREDVARPNEAFSAAMPPVLKPRWTIRWRHWFVQPAIAVSLLLLAGVTGSYLRPAPAPRLQTVSQPTPPARGTPPPVHEVAAASASRGISPRRSPSAPAR